MTSSEVPTDGKETSSDVISPDDSSHEKFKQTSKNNRKSKPAPAKTTPEGGSTTQNKTKASPSGGTTLEHSKYTPAEGSNLQEKFKIVRVDGSTIEERCKPAPAGGSTTQNKAKTTPVGGSTTQNKAKITPVGGSTTQSKAKSTPVGGSTTHEKSKPVPAGGSTTEEKSKETPAGGSTSQEKSKPAPAGGSTTQNKAKTTPVDGTTTHKKSKKTPAGDSTTHDKSKHKLVDGSTSQHKPKDTPAGGSTLPQISHQQPRVYPIPPLPRTEALPFLRDDFPRPFVTSKYCSPRQRYPDQDRSPRQRYPDQDRSRRSRSLGRNIVRSSEDEEEYENEDDQDCLGPTFLLDLNQDLSGTSHKDLPHGDRNFVDTYKAMMKVKGLQLQSIFATNRMRSDKEKTNSTEETKHKSKTKKRKRKTENSNEKNPSIDYGALFPEIIASNQPITGKHEPVTSPTPVPGCEEEGELESHLGEVMKSFEKTPGRRQNGGHQSKRLGAVMSSNRLQQLLNSKEPLRMENCYNYYP